MGRKATTKSGVPIVGMAPELKLPSFLIPKDFRRVLDNGLKEFPGMTEIQKILLTQSLGLKENGVRENNYIGQFKLLLYMEEYYREMEMRMYDLKEQKIGRYNRAKEFLVHVPGLSEDRPSLQLYDEIELKASDNSYFCRSFINYVGQDYVKIVSGDAFAKKYREDHLFNIKFLWPRRTIQCCHYALELVKSNQLVPALFPRVRTCYNKLSKSLVWFDRNIGENAEQNQAVCNIVARTAHPAPYVLFGPPGTGKTATLVEAISQIWKTSPSSNILVCTPSNAAADEILKRLLKNVPSFDIHRMYGSSRNWEDVDEKIQPCSNFAEGEMIFLPKELIMRRRIVVVTLMSCARLLALKLRENHFAYVFIDEAGQATEPETLIPLGLMSSADLSHRGRLQGQLVIAGDPMQLGPGIATKNVDTLGTSMLERLMDHCEPYRKNEIAKYNPMYITKLVRNFRSNKSILHVPNNLFYEGELIECGKDANINRALQCKYLPNKSFPLIFHPVNGEETRDAKSPSLCNMDEVWLVIKYLNDLIGANLGERKLSQKDIGIITPFKLQRTKIHQELERRNWTDVSVGTVEIFQGQERDVIIMSTVRSLMYKHNGKEHLGFLSNPKRFNVAVTRAKSLLITIGNPTVLQYDACWDALMRYCEENRAFIGGRSSLPKKLSHKDKRKLFAKKYEPAQDTNKTFRFPDELPLNDSVTSSPKKCLILPENFVINRKPRIPIAGSNLSQTPLISATSARNGLQITDSEFRDGTSSSSSAENTCSNNAHDSSEEFAYSTDSNDEFATYVEQALSNIRFS